MKTNIFIVMFALLSTYTYAQPDPTIDNTKKFSLGYQLGKSSWFFNYNIITPSGIVYFDLGKDEIDAQGNSTRPDFYKDGSGTFNLQVLSGDLFYGKSWFRGGLSLGLGVSSNSGKTDESSFVIMNVGPALTFNQNVRLEIGMSIGLSAKESYSKIYDNAFYIGLSFPTNISENIKKAIKED